MYSFEIISPEIAKQYLDTQVSNRPLTKGRVSDLAQAMQSGQWKGQTGQPIKFDKDGRLIDGQHRLSAVVQAGVSVTMEVVRGLETSVFSVLDIGKVRSAADAAIAGQLIHSSNHRHIQSLSAAAKYLISKSRKMGLVGISKVNTTDTIAFIETNAELCQRAVSMLGFSANAKRELVAKDTSFIVAYIEMVWAGGDVDRLVYYFAHLVDGVGLDDFQTKVRNGLIQSKTTAQTEYGKTGLQIRLLNIGWNAHLAGRQTGRLPALNRDAVWTVAQ